MKYFISFTFFIFSIQFSYAQMASCTNFQIESYQRSVRSVKQSVIWLNEGWPWCQTTDVGINGNEREFIYDQEGKLVEIQVKSCYSVCPTIPGYVPEYLCSYQIPACLSDELPEELQVLARENNKKPDLQCGSIIQTSNRVLGETLPIVGSSFYLNYFTDRVIGYKSNYRADIPISSADVYQDISSHTLSEITSNGIVLQSFEYDASPNQSYNYEWTGSEDGLEEWASFKRYFKVTMHMSDMDANAKKVVFVGSLRARKLGLGGWVPSIWHFYDVNTKTLYTGNGQQRTVTSKVEEGLNRVASEDGSEVYYFDSIGRLVYTKTGITGATLYTFLYDSTGRLTSREFPYHYQD